MVSVELFRISTQNQNQNLMGVQKGSKRGPYKKFNDDGEYLVPSKKKKRSGLPCPGTEKDGTRCDNLSYFRGYCSRHQHLLPVSEQKQPFVCKLCGKEITKELNSEDKWFCSTCILVAGTKCSECVTGTLNFDTKLCKRHRPERKCCTQGCKSMAHHGEAPNRYCNRHNPKNKCTHIELRPCENKKLATSEFCSACGGSKIRNGNQLQDTCMKPVQRKCTKTIPKIRQIDLPRVLDTTKCAIHGGRPKCYVDDCEKPSCIGFEGMCENHGGKKCNKCRGPLYVSNKESVCHHCKKKMKAEYNAAYYKNKKQ